MSVNHHLDDSTIVSFAAGSLPAAFAVVASGHIDMCATCRRKVKRAQAIGGAMLDEIKPVALSPGAANNMLERLGTEERKREPENSTGMAVPRSTRNGILPSAAASLIDVPVSQVKWKNVGGGISTFQIGLGNKADGKLFLMKIAAGRSVPAHRHAGHEVTLILSGAYNDECGRFASGDVADLDPDVEHQPVVEEGVDCICLVAVQRPAHFKRLLPRLLQPLVGI